MEMMTTFYNFFRMFIKDDCKSSRMEIFFFHQIIRCFFFLQNKFLSSSISLSNTLVVYFFNHHSGIICNWNETWKIIFFPPYSYFSREFVGSVEARMLLWTRFGLRIFGFLGVDSGWLLRYKGCYRWSSGQWINNKFLWQSTAN